jgi:hypothetical protein
MLLLLNEKGALTYDELLDFLCMGTHMLDYRLKVLDDFLEKTVDDKYMLSEKGKQACTILSDLPASTGVSRRWKITWLVSIVSNIVFASILGYIFNSPRPIVLMALLFSFGLVVSYALKVKPKITGRILYIVFGTGILGSLLLLFTLKIFLSGTAYFTKFPSGSTGDNLLSILSFVVCWVVGGVIGELIGKKMKYKWPTFHTF